MDRYGNEYPWPLAMPNDQTTILGESFRITPTRTATIDWSGALPYGGRVSCANTQIAETITTNYQQNQLPAFGFYWPMPSPVLSTTDSPPKQLEEEYYVGIEQTVSTPFYSPEHTMKQPARIEHTILPLQHPPLIIQHQNLQNPHQMIDDTLPQPVLPLDDPQTITHRQNLPNPYQKTNDKPVKPVLDPALKAEQSKPKLSSLVTSEWRCEECNKQFVSKTGLMRHNMVRHASVRPYRCAECGKRFLEMVLLQQHVLRHATQNKPYKCDQCPKAFYYRADLRRHGYSHTGNKPHQCSMCAKGFVRWDHMLRHELTHQNEDSRMKELTKVECYITQDKRSPLDLVDRQDRETSVIDN